MELILEEVAWGLRIGRFVFCVDAYNGMGDFYGRARVLRYRGFGITFGWAHADSPGRNA